ncbi:AMP-binding protein [Streptomyces sp. M19]
MTVPPTALAYVLYTSGSTGRPKGSASNIAARRRSCAGRARRSTGTSYATSWPPRRSASTWPSSSCSRHSRTRGPWCWPRTPCGCRKPGRRAGEPAQLRTVRGGRAAGRRRDPRRGRLGEPRRGAADPELADRLRRRRVRTVVRNLYGPSEATTYATAGVVGPGDGPPSIGTPVGTARTWVADHRGRPVPDGMTGELLIGGPALARAIPASRRPRLRRSSPTRTVGRAAVSTAPGTWCAAASTGRWTSWGAGTPRSNCAAYGSNSARSSTRCARWPRSASAPSSSTGWPNTGGWWPSPARSEGGVRAAPARNGADPGADLRPERVLAELRGLLPSVMIPAHLVVLADLPHNSNGKVDRAALAARAATVHRRQPRTAAPATELERALAREWQRVLGIDRVGVHDAFFDVGGNSLGLLRLHGALVRSVHPGCAWWTCSGTRHRQPRRAHRPGRGRDRSGGRGRSGAGDGTEGGNGPGTGRGGIGGVPGAGP